MVGRSAMVGRPGFVGRPFVRRGFVGHRRFAWGWGVPVGIGLAAGYGYSCLRWNGWAWVNVCYDPYYYGGYGYW